MTTAVAVAVASYNHAPYIEECIESIAIQDHDSIDLCWVDDASKDDTFAIVQSYLRVARLQQRFRRIVVHRNVQNRSAAYSLNLAARLSDAPLISFMNSDDYYAPTRLSRLADRLTPDAPGIAFSNVMPVDDRNKSMVLDPVGQKVAFDADLLVRRFGSCSAALLHRQIASSTGNFFMTRVLFEQIGGFKDLKYCHDWMFILQACLHCEPVFESERLYFYRLHPTNSFKSLGKVAEKETDEVLSTFYETLALGKAINSVIPSPQGRPAGFWALAAATGTKAYAERVFFPYASNSRLLISRGARS